MNDTPIPVLYCANHPDRETSLRCNRCNKPICTKCAVLTPTGYRCKECVKGQLKTFDTAELIDYPIAIVIAAILAYIGSVIAGALGFFTIFIGPVAGVIIAEAVRLATRRHRSKLLYQLTAAAAVLGSLPRVLILLLAFFLGGGGSSIGVLLPMAFQALYIFLMVSSLYYRLRGISLSF
jgi:hypothetical protein